MSAAGPPKTAQLRSASGGSAAAALVTQLANSAASAGAHQTARRRLLQTAGALAIVPWLPARAASGELPDIPALTTFLAGRKPRLARVRLTVPQLADNGQTVPMKVSVDGPFAPGPRVNAIHLFSEANPVPDMAVFEFPVAVEQVEVESRIRLAASQRIVAVATLSDGTLCAAAAEVIVTIAGCMDGT